MKISIAYLLAIYLVVSIVCMKVKVKQKLHHKARKMKVTFFINLVQEHDLIIESAAE